MDREFDARAYDQGVRDGRNEAAAEIERLRGELADAETDAVHDRQQIRENAASITALQAEIERLRAALEHYASADNWMHIPGEKYQRVWLEPDTYTRDAYDGYDIARAVLGDKNG